MIINESINNGALIRSYSDMGFMILQVETGNKYSEAVDVIPLGYTYEETAIPIEGSSEEEPQDEIENMRAALAIIGVRK